MEQTTPAGGAPMKRALPAGAKIALAVVAVLAALFAAYAAFCAWVADAHLPPGTYVTIPGVAEAVDIGDMSYENAAGALSAAAQVDESRNITVSCGGQTAVVSADTFTVDEKALLDEIVGVSDVGGFLTNGVRYLSSRGQEAATYELPYTYGETEAVETLLTQMAARVAVPAVETTYTLTEEDSVEVILGFDGSALDVEEAMADLLTAFQTGATTLTLSPKPVPPAPLTAADLNAAVYVAPVPVTVDENGATVPPIIGVSIDVEAAQAVLDGAAEGEAVTIPLVHTQPDYTEAGENGLLYQDLLSQCTTYISGSSGRLSNVGLAAEKCNGVVLLPGDTFDYNKTVGERTTAAGFKSAPAYYMGQTVDEIGGGICQMSSSLYYCAVYANLKIVTRSNHRFAVGYVPDGLDATVSWGGPEFRFRNDTDYPIKIVAFAEGRSLTVQLYGTNPDGIYVKTERARLSTTDYTTVYEPDPSIPLGTTKEEVTPYTGRKTQVYRCVYAADGTLISRTLENVSNYSHRDQVIRYNPADAASLGLEPVETDPPAESPAPGETPEITPPTEILPAETEPVETTPAEITPVESEPTEGAPAETQPTEAPAESQEPGVLPVPDPDPVPTDETGEI